MGSGASKNAVIWDSDDENPNRPEYDENERSERSQQNIRAIRAQQQARQRIFQREEKRDEYDTRLPNVQSHPPDVVELLYKSLSGFFFLQQFDGEGGAENPDDAHNSRIDVIVNLMCREEIKAGTPLIIEGEVGDKLYIVEQGELGVTIKGDFIRTIGRGALLGELALIYDCPRSATVMCKTDTSVYTLQRKIFKRVVAISVDAAVVQRSRWLLNSPELAVFTPLDLSRLVAALKPVTYPKGHFVYREMELTSQITLVEKGSATIMTSMDLGELDVSEIDKMFGIVRPLIKNRMKSVSAMTYNELQKYLNSIGPGSLKSPRLGSGDPVNEHSNATASMTAAAAAAAAASATAAAAVSASDDDNNNIASSPYKDNDEGKSNVWIDPSGQVWYVVCEVNEGCLLGVGALRGRSGVTNSWRWVTEAELQKKGVPIPPDFHSGKAETPFSLIAAETLECQIFTIETFESLFGSIMNILTSDKTPTIPDLPERTGFPFDMSKFKILSVLGSGSFGTVTLAEYMADSSPMKNSKGTVLEGTYTGQPNDSHRYALKSLSKVAIIETGQLRHVLDERRILFAMDNPFILKLYGVYQTPHQIVMVTEAIECGDLWGVIYEEKLVSDIGGIPHDLVQMYAASLIYALDHIHTKLVVYRDLKPENVMVDRNGYLRLIDFGFAKRVPYVKLDGDGVSRICAKTFTLCGTPEYLPPELIFNLGHDHMADIWSFGVVLYEMVMGRTPFAPKKPDNITELFTNIAMAKKNGLLLSTRIDDRAGKNSHARELITQLLKPEPTDRFANDSTTRSLLRHAYFNNLDLDALFQHRLIPSFVPEPMMKKDSATTLQPVKAFSGDQSIFDAF